MIELTKVSRVLAAHRWQTLGWAILDAAMVLAAYIASLVVHAVTAPLDQSIGPWFTWFIIAVMLLMQYACGVYRRVWSRTSGHEVGTLVKAVGLATLVILIAHALSLGDRSHSTSVIVLGNTLVLVGFVAARYRGRLLSGFSWRWRAIWFHEFPAKSTRVLIVGAGEPGQITAWQLKHGAPAGTQYCVVGFVDGDTGRHGMYVEGCEILGGYERIPWIVQHHQVELVVIAIQRVSGPLFREILSHCEKTDARIKVMPDIFELLSRKQAVPMLRDVQAEDFLDRNPVGRCPSVDLAPVTHKVILVTGAAGSIGSELSHQLLDFAPAKLLLLDNNESALHDLVTEISIQSAGHACRVEPILADVTNHPEMRQIFEHHRPQVVFHSAAYKHVPMLERFPNKAVQVNVGGTRCVAELSREFDVQRFVLISSDKAVCPSNIMGATKRICELLMIALSQQNGHETLFTSVRFGNVLGSRGSVVPTFNRQIDAGGPVTVTDKAMRRYFMTIPEAANLVIHAACLTKGGDLFMPNMGTQMAIVDLAERMIRMRGLRPYVDIAIEFMGMRPGEKLCEALHADCEDLRPTCHPDIFQLIDSHLDVHPQHFLAQLDQLHELGFLNDDGLRHPLLALARPEEASTELAATLYPQV